MASRREKIPPMGAYWLKLPSRDFCMSRISVGSTPKSGNPCERLIAPVSVAIRLILLKIEVSSSGSFEASFGIMTSQFY